MVTKDFETKTIMQEQPFPGSEEKWVIGLDIGYSAVKGISQNALWCFPAYAKQIPSDRLVLKSPEKTDIRYRDNSGTWVVGNLAYNEATVGDIIDSESELYGRHRYFSPMFKVIASVGLALGLNENSFGSPKDKKIVLQTGLPPKYLIGDDKNDLVDALAGHYCFELAVGNKDWKKYEFTIDRENLYIMAQPLGALVSASVSKNGKPVPTARNYYSSDVIVFDPGFGTVDSYVIHMGNVMKERCETFSNLGMHEVFERTCNDIMNQFNIQLPITEFQSRLAFGNIKIVNKKKMSSQLYDFSELLDKNCRQVCADVIEKLKSVYNYFARTDYIIATGGTYEAWKNIFSDTFSEMTSLQLVPANINDVSLSNVFSNVRGYYFYRLNAKG